MGEPVTALRRMQTHQCGDIPTSRSGPPAFSIAGAPFASRVDEQSGPLHCDNEGGFICDSMPPANRSGSHLLRLP